MTNALKTAVSTVSGFKTAAVDELKKIKQDVLASLVCYSLLKNITNSKREDQVLSNQSRAMQMFSKCFATILFPSNVIMVP